MPDQFALERADYSDLASGCVLHSLPGHPAFPVRMASEVFQRCLSHRSARQPEHCTLYDPCCGAAYLLTTLSYLHRRSIHEVIGSDINLQAVELAKHNLDLLTLAGLNRRISQLKRLYGLYGKGSHRAALESAGRLRSQLAELPEAERIETNVFQVDATNRQALSTGLSGSQVDIVLADVPYGQHSGWQGGAVETSDPVGAVLGVLLNVLAPTSLVALATDKQQKVSHSNYERLERFQIGTRQVAILRPLF